MKLQVRQLEKVIENRCVLSIGQLDLAEGEVLAVIGPVGSAKTLLLRLLCGELTPSRGTVILDGKSILHDPSARAQMGILFEDDMLYERQTVQNNLEFYCQLQSLPRERVAEVLALVGMGDQERVRVNKLSSSSQRRLAFARTLLKRPSVLLLDQITLRTDMDTQVLFARLISELAAGGTALLLTDEDLAWTGRCCTHVMELEDGRVISNYQRQELKGTEPEPAEQPLRLIPERHSPFKVPARKEDRILLYDPADLLYATSRDGKTFLRTATEEVSTNLTLQVLEQRLVGRGFFKAHRAYLVNIQRIKAVIQYTRNSYTLLLNDEHETMIPLSKQCEKELQDLLGY